MIQTWTHIDSRRVMSAADQALVTRWGEALMAGDRIHLELPALMHLMRDAMAGQPQAAHAGERGTPSAWCWAHERTVDACHRDDLLCSGEVTASHSDPAGNAAVSGDRAAADLRDVRRLVELHCRIVDQLHAVASRYPAHPEPRTDIEATPGEDWCRSCWRDGKYHEPIGQRANGQPYYRGLCRWCGQLAKTIGAALPPLDLVERKHRGERITDGMVEAAKTDTKRKAKGRKKTKA